MKKLKKNIVNIMEGGIEGSQPEYAFLAKKMYPRRSRVLLDHLTKEQLIRMIVETRKSKHGNIVAPQETREKAYMHLPRELIPKEYRSPSPKRRVSKKTKSEIKLSGKLEVIVNEYEKLVGHATDITNSIRHTVDKITHSKNSDERKEYEKQLRAEIRQLEQNIEYAKSN